MACFVVPVAEAVITTVATKVIEKKEKKAAANPDAVHSADAVKIPFSKKLKWLNRLLWGGSALLAFEHVWHGEVVPYFPFLTAAADPQEASVMLHEMATVGVAMAAVVTLAWLGLLAVAKIAEKKARRGQAASLPTE